MVGHHEPVSVDADRTLGQPRVGTQALSLGQGRRRVHPHSWLPGADAAGVSACRPAAGGALHGQATR